MDNSRSLISSQLQKQITAFIDVLEDFNKINKNPRSHENYIFLRDFFPRFIVDHNKRAREVASKEYEEIMHLANAQFSDITLWNLCMDGRVLAILMNGACAKVGSSINTPAGVMHEFVRSKAGDYRLLDESNFAQLLKKALERSEGIVYEVFDSHVGCAARKAEQLAIGVVPQDVGLLADVVIKKEMAAATIIFVQDNLSTLGQVVPIQTSFDPQTGFLYMGLETEKALKYAKEHGGAYTTKVLEELAKNKRIIATESLLFDKIFIDTFKDHAFVLDWQSNYVESAERFWHAIATIKETLLPHLEKELQIVYPHLEKADSLIQKELHERAMLILTNAFSGFLHNQAHWEDAVIAGEDMHNGNFREYAFGAHTEEGVSISEGAHPPYKTSMFGVFSLDLKNLPANLELAESLVRSNRREKRIGDHTGVFADPDAFATAAVPVFVKETIRDPLTPEEWEKLAVLDWSDLPENWNTMDDREFLQYLQKKGDMSITVTNSINSLRGKMRVLFDPERSTAAHLVDQYKVAIPVVIDNNKETHFVVPFVKLGF